MQEIVFLSRMCRTQQRTLYYIRTNYQWLRLILIHRPRGNTLLEIITRYHRYKSTGRILILPIASQVGAAMEAALRPLRFVARWDLLDQNRHHASENQGQRPNEVKVDPSGTEQRQTKLFVNE